jgi:hypothetical protein
LSPTMSEPLPKVSSAARIVRKPKARGIRGAVPKPRRPLLARAHVTRPPVRTGNQTCRLCSEVWYVDPEEPVPARPRQRGQPAVLGMLGIRLSRWTDGCTAPECPVCGYQSTNSVERDYAAALRARKYALLGDMRFPLPRRGRTRAKSSKGSFLQRLLQQVAPKFRALFNPRLGAWWRHKERARHRLEDGS